MEFISSNFLAIFMALLSGTMLIWSFIGNAVRGIKQVDARAALQLINHKDAFILDVREPSEFKDGHILNAKLIPLGKLHERIAELEDAFKAAWQAACPSGATSRTAPPTRWLGESGVTSSGCLPSSSSSSRRWSQKASTPGIGVMRSSESSTRENWRSTPSSVRCSSRPARSIT